MTHDPAAIALVRQAADELLAELIPVAEVADSSAAADDLYPAVARAFDQCLVQLRSTKLLGEANKVPSSVLWNIAGRLLDRGWLQHRARNKPRGYPGDYEMLVRFYERRLCDDPLGRLFDRYFQDQPAPRAVENRMRMITAWIMDGIRSLPGQPLKVSLVGSAFGLEIRDAVLQLQPQERALLHVTLLDLDPGAIDFGRHLLAPLLSSAQLTLVNDNPLRLTKRPPLAAALEGSDLLFCPGVFDYLNNAAACDMLRLLYSRLAPGGALTVFQFAPRDPTRAYMEWIGNWYLTYRDAATFCAMAEEAALEGTRLQFGAEPLGVDLYVTATRP
jgi:hypothetical protein